MKATWSSEMLVSLHNITLRRKPEDHDMNAHLCETLTYGTYEYLKKVLLG